MAKSTKPRRLPRRREHLTALPNVTSFPSDLEEIALQLAPRYTFDGDIAKGKTGIAYRLRSATYEPHLVCLKTIRPDITDERQRADVRDTLTKEVAILSKLSHRAIPAILEDGTTATLPYYVCTYHSGLTFESSRKANRRLTIPEAVYIISELLSVIVHVHGAGRSHCDLHTNNILLATDIFRHGLMVIDFGSGHRFSDTTPDTPNRGNAAFKPTESLRTDRHSVIRSEHAQSFLQADIVALGKLLIQMEEVFVSAGSPLVRDEYRRFCSDLDAKRLVRIADVDTRARLVFDPLRCINENSDLLVNRLQSRDRVTLPVSGSVPIGAAPAAVINTREFQRLRTLKQLSFCDWAFPGATHSRFEHALGVYGNAWEVIHHLAYDPSFRHYYGPSEVRAFLLAALVHDVGHYPFAHAVEQYAAGRLVDEHGAEFGNVARHEVYTLRLMDTECELRQRLISEWGESTLAMAKAILVGNGGALSRLLDGPLDVDKMDYLCRDAFHSGVSLGARDGTAAVIRSLVCSRDGTDIYAAKSHLPAVEGFVLLQDQMYGALYWHHRVRGVHAMFQAVLANIVERNRERLKNLVERLLDCPTETEAIDKVIKPLLEKSPRLQGVPEIGKRLLSMCDALRYPHYSKAFDILAVYRHSDKKPTMALNTVYETLFSGGSGGMTAPRIDWENVSRLRRCYVRAAQVHDNLITDVDVLVDVPIGKGPKRFAHVVNGPDDEPQPINEVTHISRSAFEQPVYFWSPVRVFLAPQFSESARLHGESIMQRAEEDYLARRDMPQLSNPSPI